MPAQSTAWAACTLEHAHARKRSFSGAMENSWTAMQACKKSATWHTAGHAPVWFAGRVFYLVEEGHGVILGRVHAVFLGMSYDIVSWSRLSMRVCRVDPQPVLFIPMRSRLIYLGLLSACHSGQQSASQSFSLSPLPAQACKSRG